MSIKPCNHSLPIIDHVIGPPLTFPMTVPIENVGVSEEMRVIVVSRNFLFPMLLALTTLFVTLSSIFRSRAALELENLALRHQIGILQRSARKRPKLTSW